jgi:hypothetical protein
MRARTSFRVGMMLLKASVAMTFAASPLHLVVTQDGAGLELTSAFAKNGGDSSGSGSGGGDSSGSGSGRGGDAGDNDNSGPGSGDDRGNGDHSGPGRGNDDRDRDRDRDRDDDRNDARDEHVNPANGVRVEIEGNNIEVEFPDGTKEEIENGRFERKNALGRTIVERPATARDVSRLRAFAG